MWGEPERCCSDAINSNGDDVNIGKQTKVQADPEVKAMNKLSQLWLVIWH